MGPSLRGAEAMPVIRRADPGFRGSRFRLGCYLADRKIIAVAGSRFSRHL